MQKLRAFALFWIAVLSSGAGASAASGSASLGAVHGTVTTLDGAPIPNAQVTFNGAGRVTTVRCSADGAFHVEALSPGTYVASVYAKGYRDLSGRTIDVLPEVDTALSFSLSRATSSLVTIGSVQANGSDTISTSSAATTLINPEAYAVLGYTQVSDVLQNDVAATLVHPLGGSATSLPASVALRGPDPTETLVAVDGHQINNGNTGDFDLSLLDPADYGAIELIEGISPSALVGPNTIDGAINLRTIEPTVVPRVGVRLGAGSDASFFETLQATGTDGRLGYALSVHKTTTNGQVNATVVNAASGSVQQVGSAVDGSTLSGLLRYALGNAGAFAAFTVHDQSLYRDLSAGLSSIPPSGTLLETNAPFEVVDSFAGTTMGAHNASYGLDIGVPLGRSDSAGVTRTSVLVRGFSALVSQSVFGPGADTSPYLYNDRDLVNDASLSINYQLPRSSLTAAYEIRNEQLETDFVSAGVNAESIVRGPGRLAPLDASGASGASSGVATLPLAQTERSALLRYSLDPTANLHYTLAAYYSDYSTFGTNVDPRFGFAWTPSAQTAVRFSVGSTYQAPQLTELYIPPTLPKPVGGYVSVGNPHLKADYATEYGIGVEHLFATGAHRTSLALDLYRVNLREPSSTYLPAPVSGCGAGAGSPLCPLSFPINAGDGVYQGFELSMNRRVAPNVVVQAAYAVHSAYLTKIPPYIQDGTLVAGEQTLGLPLHKATLSIVAAPPRGFNFGAGLVYEGQYNELNQPPYATLAASLGYRWRACEFTLAGANLTNVYAQQFTRQGAGVPHAGLTGPIATDSYALPATTFTLSFSYHT